MSPEDKKQKRQKKLVRGLIALRACGYVTKTEFSEILDRVVTDTVTEEHKVLIEKHMALEKKWAEEVS
jgi:uncharacterized membrane protein YebE (DUF533 family)